MAGFMAATSHDKWSTTVDYTSMAFVCEKPTGCKLMTVSIMAAKHNDAVHY